MLSPRLLLLALAAPAAAAPAAAQDNGFRFPYDGFVLHDADGDPLTTGDQVRLTGQLGIDVEPTFCTNLATSGSCGHVLEAGGALVGVGSLHVSADVAATIDQLWVADPGLAPLPLATVPTGIGDVTFSLQFLGALQVAGDVEAGMVLDAAVEAPFDATFSFDPGFDFSAGLGGVELATSKPQLSGATALSLTVSTFAVVELQVSLNGLPLPSPSFWFGPALTLDVDPAANPWWSLSGSAAVMGSFGILPTATITGPTVLASAALPGLDAGGAVGDPGQLDDTRFARIYDFGGYVNTEFVIPSPNDPTATLVGTSTKEGIHELDAHGDVVESWSWIFGSPRDAAEGPTGTMVCGARGTDAWFAEYLGGGTFGVSKTFDLLDGFGTELPFTPERIERLPGGDYVLGGEASVNGNENRRVLIRMTAAGAVVWAKQYGPGNLGDSFEDLVVGDDGAIYMTGRLEDPGFGDGAIVAKVSPNGNPIWGRLILDDVGTARTPQAIAFAPSGDLVIAGFRALSPATPGPAFAIFTRTLDPVSGMTKGDVFHGSAAIDGTVLYGGSLRDRVSDLVTTGGGLALVGTCSEAFEYQAWMWTLGTALAHTDVAVYRTDSYDALERVRTTADGGLLAVGDSRGFVDGSQSNLFVVKTGAMPHVELDPAFGGEKDHWAFSGIGLAQDPIAYSAVPVDLTVVLADQSPSLVAPNTVTVTVVGD